MTLHSFLDAAQALLVNEYQRLGLNLMDALEQTSTWQAGGKKELAEEKFLERRQRKSTEEVTAAQNDQALQMLQGMLAGASK